ncbi:hypothetical protein AA0120_g3950 [Alternaria tenuissima]|jgi:hypothetical protein|nr:hypothetical protein AA0120_g3950 [Alternaria tenuissima]
MAQSVPKGADEFSPNEHHDKVCEPLNEDSDDAKQATSKDYLATTNLVCDEASGEDNHEGTNCRSSVQHLLVAYAYLNGTCGCLLTESIEKYRGCDDVADQSKFKPKVDRKEEDKQA